MSLLSFLFTLLFFFSPLPVFSLSSRSTILVIVRTDPTAAITATTALQGYGIPYELLTVPSGGTTLPTLIDSSGVGNYGGFLILSEVSYPKPDKTFGSSLTPAQWAQLYDYQAKFGARMVRLDAYPTADFGTAPVINGTGCCDFNSEQFVYLKSTEDFPTSGLRSGVPVSTKGLWHYPSLVTNSSIAKPIAEFSPANSTVFSSTSVAAVINTFPTRRQMVFFMSWASEWSVTSSFMQHVYITWLTRGLYQGFRRVYFSAQVDDVLLVTDLYRPRNTLYRITPQDLSAHVSWSQKLTQNLPAGSYFVPELGYNGNGNIEAAVTKPNARSICTPPNPVDYPEQIDPPIEFKKPLGTGVDVWPATFTNYTWSAACIQLDPLENFIASNIDNFYHVSHTFTHYELNNATYYDASREIYFNRAWLAQTGISASSRYSPKGLIPPAITGLHNGDVLRAWSENGITYVVGDNTRPVLLNKENPHWPLISTVDENGFDGVLIMPRWATNIYYNCDTAYCTTQEWKDTSAGKGNFQQLLDDSREVNVRHLLNLRHDPFMFHQANLRQADATPIVVNGVPRKISIYQAWIETVAYEMNRLTIWPLITLKHDDLAIEFLNRMTRDKCQSNLIYNYSTDGKSIVSVTVTANTLSCGARIPVTVPNPISVSSSNMLVEHVGNDPYTVWVTLAGEPVTIPLATTVPV